MCQLLCQLQVKFFKSLFQISDGLVPSVIDIYSQLDTEDWIGWVGPGVKFLGVNVFLLAAAAGWRGPSPSCQDESKFIVSLGRHTGRRSGELHDNNIIGMVRLLAPVRQNKYLTWDQIHVVSTMGIMYRFSLNF